MKNLRPINPDFDLDIVDSNGIELYDSQGNTYLDLNEISTVLGEKNPHFIKRMTEKLSGVHIGAILAKEITNDPYRIAMAGGSGDSELNMTAGCAVFEELLENGLLEHIRDVSDYLQKKLISLHERYADIKNISCRGLACSIEMQNEESYNKVMKACQEHHLIVGKGANHKIVLRPPYVITCEQIDKVVGVLEKTFSKKIY